MKWRSLLRKMQWGCLVCREKTNKYIKRNTIIGMIKKRLIPILFLMLPCFAFAQNLSLLDYRGEWGGHIGTTSYFGQLGSGVNNFRPNFGIFYRKNLLPNLTLSMNYEYIPLGANDTLSNNYETLSRGFEFFRTFHEISFGVEYFFYENHPYSFHKVKFNPYVGIGMGYILNVPKDENNFKTYFYDYVKVIDQFIPIATIPIHVGLQYNYNQNFRFFGEIDYRFTSSDVIDHFGNEEVEKTLHGNFTPANNGNDRFVSFKLGVSKLIVYRY